MKKSAILRKPKQWGKLAAIVVVAGYFLVTVISQQINLHQIRRETAEYDRAIAALESEYQQLEQKQKFYTTDEFYAEKARDAGYIREDEVLFVMNH